MKLFCRYRFHADLSVGQLRHNLFTIAHTSKTSLERRFPKLKITPETLDGVPVEWIDSAANGAQDQPVVLYFHGGGYFMGSVDCYRRFGVRLSHKVGATVVLVDYRLAPEYPFPAAYDDAWKIYRRVAEQVGYNRLWVAGDSAGGGLTLALLQRIQTEGGTLPRAAFCFSPWTDLAITGESVEKNRRRDHMIRGRDLKRWNQYYLSGTDPEDPRVSPLYGDFSGLPPLMVHAGTEETLLSDSSRVIERARQQGVDASLTVFEGMQHVFQGVFSHFPESRQSLSQVRSFIERTR